MDNFFRLRKFIPVSVIGLVMICALAVFSDYTVSIDSKHGFRFEPVKTKSMKIIP
jgi:hypothetical protein